MKDPEAVAAIVSALREAHGDEVARIFLADGVTLAALVDAVLSLPIKNSAAVRAIARALESGDFTISPDIGPLWHVKYVYSHPGSMTVADMVVLTPERTFTSTEISLLLRV
ncbi:hypothetical protein ACE103_17020 [Bradyrhizobium sp. ma5]|uniref:hypothetical protein n=1 Tax=Bradyrhizobium sp. ma5 TaxID=3344828 RepID=UPI0035D43351